MSLPRGEEGKRPSVVEVGQRAYTPLHVRPVDWLSNSLSDAGSGSAQQRESESAARVAQLAVELRLGLGEGSAGEPDGEEFAASLLREHEDWAKTPLERD